MILTYQEQFDPLPLSKLLSNFRHFSTHHIPKTIKIYTGN